MIRTPSSVLRFVSSIFFIAGALSVAARPVAAQVPARAQDGETAEGQVTPSAEVGDVDDGADEIGADETGADETGADEIAVPEEAILEAPVQEPSPVGSEPTRDAWCAGRAREAAANAVVRVRSGGQWGAGFVYHSSRHVVTAFSLIQLGQAATVVARDGRHYETRLLAHDADYDLAILELTEPIPDVEPLAPAPETSAAVGAAVIAIGHPFAGVARLLGERGEGLLAWSVSEGTIGAVNGFGIQADLALTAGHAGAPLLDCSGRVLGMVAGSGLLSADLGLVARVGRVDELIEGAGEASEFLGDLRLRMGLGAAIVIDEEGAVAAGFYLTIGAILFDRLSWMNRVGLFMGGLPDPVGDELEVSRTLVRVETMLGYRFFVDIGGLFTVYIVPSGGATIANDRRSTRTAAVTPGCVPSDTESCIAFTTAESDEWIVRPAASLDLLFGDNLQIGYTFELGLETPQVETYHTVRVGLLF